MMEIKGKTALVTGGASGIGLACVRELLREGAQVCFCDCVEAQGVKVLQDLREEFGEDRVTFLKTDVTDPEQLEDAFKTAISTFQGLDLVFNNAGILDYPSWEKTIEVNVVAVTRGIHLAYKYMGKQNGGRGGFVCNTASVTGLMPVLGTPVYSGTKHAVVGLTRSFGLPFHTERSGVRVVAICPGLTATSLIAEYGTVKWEEEGKADAIKAEVRSFPLQCAEDVAIAMMTLVQSAESGSIWVIEAGNPVYEVKIPPYSEMRVE